MPVSQIPFGDLTHLMIGRVIPNADGSVDDTTFDIDAVNGPAFAHAAVNAAHAAGRKAILMIGGAGEIDGWRGAASDANWSNFATTLSNTANTYGADGLDIDWEPITDNNASNAQITSDHTELARLVTALRARRPDLLLTMPVGGYNPNDAPNVSEQSLFTAVTPQLDQINLMRTLGASKFQIFRKLVVPASLTDIFAGLKLTVGFALIGAIVGEFMSSSEGLGHAIFKAGSPEAYRSEIAALRAAAEAGRV